MLMDAPADGYGRGNFGGVNVGFWGYVDDTKVLDDGYGVKNFKVVGINNENSAQDSVKDVVVENETSNGILWLTIRCHRRVTTG